MPFSHKTWGAYHHALALVTFLDWSRPSPGLPWRSRKQGLKAAEATRSGKRPLAIAPSCPACLPAPIWLPYDPHSWPGGFHLQMKPQRLGSVATETPDLGVSWRLTRTNHTCVSLSRAKRSHSTVGSLRATRTKWDLLDILMTASQGRH